MPTMEMPVYLLTAAGGARTPPTIRRISNDEVEPGTPLRNIVLKALEMCGLAQPDAVVHSLRPYDEYAGCKLKLQYNNPRQRLDKLLRAGDALLVERTQPEFESDKSKFLALRVRPNMLKAAAPAPIPAAAPAAPPRGVAATPPATVTGVAGGLKAAPARAPKPAPSVWGVSPAGMAPVPMPAAPAAKAAAKAAASPTSVNMTPSGEAWPAPPVIAAAARTPTPPRTTDMPPPPPASDAVDEEVWQFLRALNLPVSQHESLCHIIAKQEITDLDTMRLLTEPDWQEMGVKMGTRKKVISVLSQ